MNVSMRTPRATAAPTWNRIWTGAVMSAANVPARMIPADVITVPVRAEANRMPSFTPRLSLSSRTRLMRKML